MNRFSQNKIRSFTTDLEVARAKALQNANDTKYYYASCGQINGCNVINDSQSTGVPSTLVSLEMTETPVHLILGNPSMVDVLSMLEKQIKLKVISLGFVGNLEGYFNAEIRNWVDEIYFSSTINVVLSSMKNKLKAGQTLLFSPACPSGDFYSDYNSRGNAFDAIIKNWIN